MWVSSWIYPSASPLFRVSVTGEYFTKKRNFCQRPCQQHQLFANQILEKFFLPNCWFFCQRGGESLCKIFTSGIRSLDMCLCMVQLCSRIMLQCSSLFIYLSKRVWLWLDSAMSRTVKLLYTLPLLYNGTFNPTLFILIGNHTITYFCVDSQNQSQTGKNSFHTT